MPVDIQIDKNAVKATVLDAWNKGLPLLSEEILNDCNQYCKMREGALISSSLTHSVPAEGKLIWQTPYARRQYWEIKTAIQDKNPKATWKWCEVATQYCLKKWIKQAQKLMEMNL